MFGGLDREIGGLALNGAQDVGVGGAAAARRHGRAGQGRVGGGIGAGFARAFATGDGVGDLAQRLGQGFGRARGQATPAPGGGLGRQGLRRIRFGQVDQRQEAVHRRQGGGGEAQQHGRCEFSSESLGLGRRSQGAAFTPLGRQSRGPTVDGVVEGMGGATAPGFQPSPARLRRGHRSTRRAL